MPARTNSTTAVKLATGAASKRFELPALDFKFGSLTEGTDIPPPPPSPKLEPVSALTPPKTPGANTNANGKPNGAAADSSTPPASTSPGGTKRPANDNPASPTLSTRQGSIRRLFSKNMLNNAYQEGENNNSLDSQRPESRLSTATNTTKKPKRASGWFSRLRSSEGAGNSNTNKRASTLPPPVPEKSKKPSGPPPPMIPELETKFGATEDGGLSADLFKDIK
ncbi:hypothetical protein GE09DRAFT_1220865 [Coniochaeta sp. 2T2.1]|nr:hypothetical protein GE09DRAFT_1220865 [Coniochaeta sp. 2T2.1]